MNKITNVLILTFCLFMTACSNKNDELQPETPIQFSKHDFTIVFGGLSTIPFTGGGDVYELDASNPEVLGEFGIDIETHRLLINPAKVGVSTLNILDVNSGNTVTLNITVENFYISFKIKEIEGDNTNEFFQINNDIRFIRNVDNTKPVKVIFHDPTNFYSPYTRAEGYFNIERSDANVFTMTFSLQGVENTEIETFEYTMGGDGAYLSIFNKVFDFNWSEVDSSRSAPPIEYKMTLTNNTNGCKITCLLQPLKFD